MALIPLKIPPGVYRNGTEYQSSGRFYDSNLVRWYEGTLRPVGGWQLHSTTQLSGAPRGILTWRDNSNDRWIGVGTHTHLYVLFESGAVTDITPSGYTAGTAGGEAKLGYGYLAYGAFNYGVSRPDIGAITQATTWSLDTWGQNLIACANTDGKIYEWALNTAVDAAVLTNAPTSCTGIVVTAERSIFALGAGGDKRKIAWCDQENNTVWTATEANQAGAFSLTTSGSLMCGKRVRGLTIIFTDVDAHIATYVGAPFVYQFDRIGTGCGIISKQAVAATDNSCVWLSRSGFWTYDGFVKPLESDVADFVLNDINYAQDSKIYAVHNSSFGEIWWYYPNASSTEVNSYVSYNYREGHWAIGELSRTAGTDRGVFTFPLMVTSNGYVYQHETGLLDVSLNTPYAQSGPIELGNGDQVMSVTEIIPDENTLGDVQISFKSKPYPTGPESSHGPYTAAQKTDVRFTARQVEVRYTGTAAKDWRVGVPRLNVKPAGGR